MTSIPRYQPLQEAQAKPRIYLPQKVDQPDRGESGATASAVRIGIVDGPIAAISALEGVRIVRRNFLAPGEAPAPGDHATSIATLISGRDDGAGFAGIAPRSLLYSAEIMRLAGPEEYTSSAVLIRALNWLLAEKVQLVNLSLGGPGDKTMALAFARLAALPVVIVAAAGNAGPTASPSYPAAYAGVIAATATDAADNAYTKANAGSYIALAAPGVDLWVPDADSGHYVSGTSFSAAVVTAASALVLGYRAGLDGKSIKHHLCLGAKDLGVPGTDPVYGCGLIQIGAALRALRQ